MANSSGAMPTPVSSISKHNRWLTCPTHTRKLISPVAVNLIAFEIKFIKTWRSFRSSVNTDCGTSGCFRIVNCSPLALALGCHISTNVWSCRSRSKLVSLRIVRPASILDISNTSLIKSNRCSPLRAIVSKYSCRWATSRLAARLLWRESRANSWVNPRMIFSGVRSSWLILARNWLLARLAASAACLALARATSTRLRSVISSLTTKKQSRPFRSIVSAEISTVLIFFLLVQISTS